jgi:hypothetical protein
VKNLEAVHTVRIYDAAFADKLDILTVKEGKRFRNKNDLLIALLKCGYESYVLGGARAESADETLKEIYPLLLEISKYLTAQFQDVYLNHRLLQSMLSSVYGMVRGLNAGEPLPQRKIDEGFYDDLPARFEKLVLSLKATFGKS